MPVGRVGYNVEGRNANIVLVSNYTKQSEK